MSWQPDLPYNAVICRYNEIATKGRNRKFFIERLCESLRNRLTSLGHLRFELEHSRIFFRPGEDSLVFDREALRVLREETPTIPGVSSLSPGFLIRPTLESIQDTVLNYYPLILNACPLRPGQQLTYAMRVRRSDKDFPMTAEEIERHFARIILEAHPELKIDLKNAELLIEVEIRKERAFVSFERIAGAGGLPAGTAGNVMALLSGGFDSPVACYEMMRRGCHVDYITFHSSPYTPPATLDKVVRIVKQLNSFQKRGALIAVNLLPAQKAIRDNCLSKHRTVLYRRLMLRLATITARLFKAEALVTGDNLGQVASQTLPNMSVINQATDMMILRPLLTFDKLDTMAIAEKIQTYDLSKENVPDSCTVFSPTDPTTAAILEHVIADEAKLDMDDLIAQCCALTTMITPRKLSEHPWNPLRPPQPGQDGTI